MKGFYLTLPSNSSIDTYPENSLAHYFTALPKRLSLDGEWECGLSEIHYTRSWHNVNECTIDVAVKNRYGTYIPYGIVVPEGDYKDPAAFIKEINKLTSIDWGLSDRSIAPFSLRYLGGKVELTLQTETQLKLEESLRAILGFKQNVFTNTRGPQKFVSELPIDLTKGVSCMYVYTDIIKPRIVGDTTARLLRVLPIRGAQGETTTLDMQNIQYMDVSNPDFDTVELLICDGVGKKIPFTYGRVVVTLHFREKNTL